ncbi:MAG: hypothetical protein RIC16_10840 [Rhodospirillales bacterium]
MKIGDTSADARFDFKTSPPAGNGPGVNDRQHQTAPATANVPALVNLPATLVDIEGPHEESVESDSRRSSNAWADPEALERRRNAREMIGIDVDVRAMSPRDASDVGLQLYAEGLVTWEEYAELAFQPELHPSYNETIGALLGEKANPDQPRDFVAQWEERLAYEQRYNAIDSSRVKSTQRITSILGRLAGDKLSIDV